MSADFGQVGIKLMNTLNNDNIMGLDKGNSKSSVNISPRTYANKQSVIEESKTAFGFQQEEVIDTLRDSKPNKINSQNLFRKK